MSNTSATGGYVLPTTTQGLPGNLSLEQFIQTVLVGVSGIQGELVRPRWQVAPPKQPDIATNWMAFGVRESDPQANSYVWLNEDDKNVSSRHETLDVMCAIYGPKAMDYAGLIRDGFQIQQNLEALRKANMGFVNVGKTFHIPDLVNERFINRIEMSVFLRRQVQRTYPILPILSVNGTIHTVLGNEEYLMEFKSPEET